MQYQKELILKDGRACVLRGAEETDAQGMLEMFNLTHAQTDFLLTYPEENTFTVDDEAKFLAQRAKSENEIEICAVIDGKIVGSAGIESLGTKEKLRHRAELGVAIEREYWGLGIGKALMLACIDCAKQAGFLQLELSVVAENTAAIGLYTALGFREFGRNPKAFRARRGWQELVLMRLEL